MKFNAQKIAHAIGTDARMPSKTYVEVGPSVVQMSPHEYVFVYPKGEQEGDDASRIIVSPESEYVRDSTRILVGMQTGNAPNFQGVLLSSVNTTEGALGEVIGLAQLLSTLKEAELDLAGSSTETSEFIQRWSTRGVSATLVTHEEHPRYRFTGPEKTINELLTEYNGDTADTQAGSPQGAS